LEWKSWRLESEMVGDVFFSLVFLVVLLFWWAVIVWNDDVVLLNGVVGECDG